MRVLTRRKPELLLLAALLVFAITLATRTLLERMRPPAATQAPAAQPLEASDERAIARLQERIRRNPDDAEAYAQLGLAYLQRVRVTADPSLYTKAEQALGEALKRDPQQTDALVGQGTLALARHAFADALRWGERARDSNPYRAQTYGIIGDALVELGRYDEAVQAVQKMVDTRPDLNSYSRVSYLRELHGDTAGAIKAMGEALQSGGAANESTLWTQVQLGHLYFNSGDLRQAEASYLQALSARPDYAYARAGVARLLVAQGRYAEAIRAYSDLVEALPLPEFVIALGELYEARGRMDDARQQYDLVRAIQQLNATAGMDVDLELALFDADHGADPQQALTRARAAYERRPSIYAADTLAWTLHRSGDHAAARRYSQEALRLGTRDALLHYHAGVIAFALGDTAAARTHLTEALAINPHFSVLRAPEAQRLLEQM